MKIKSMESFLYWYAENNRTIIQFLCVSIGMVIIYFIYRIFFSSAAGLTESGEEPAQATSRQISDLDKKITKIIDYQIKALQPTVYTGEADEYEANAKAEASTLTAMVNSSSPESSVESEAMIKKIQSEIAYFKKELQFSQESMSEKTAELNTVKEKLIEYQMSGPPTEGLQKGMTLTGDAALISKIEELQKKLQEYDIISDDIAELQSLRAENADLKTKISAG